MPSNDSGTTAPPPVPLGASQFSASTVQAQRDVTIGSTINAWQTGGLRTGDGAQFLGPVAERIIYQIYNYGTQGTTAGEAGGADEGDDSALTDEQFAEHYL